MSDTETKLPPLTLYVLQRPLKPGQHRGRCLMSNTYAKDDRDRLFVLRYDPETGKWGYERSWPRPALALEILDWPIDETIQVNSVPSDWHKPRVRRSFR